MLGTLPADGRDGFLAPGTIERHLEGGALQHVIPREQASLIAR